METQSQRSYVDLHTVYPAIKLESKNYEIEPFSLTEEQVSLEKMRNFRNYWLTSGLKANFNYVRLVKKGGFNDVMMSDTPMERNTNTDFLTKANGDVIVFGLGLGLIIIPLLSDPTIKSITVVELYQDLIDTVLPILKPLDKENKLIVVQGDAFTYKLKKEAKFDTIYFDIWVNICSGDYEEHKQLMRMFRKHLNKDNPNAFMSCWLHETHKAAIRREKRSGYYLD
jgi:spermidine synthase